MRSIPRCNQRSYRSALTLIEVLAIIGTFMLLAIIFAGMYPYMQHQPCHRAICTSNLKGMGTGFYTYANENNDCWPNFGPPTPEKEEDRIQVTYAPGLIGKDRTLSDQQLIERFTGGKMKLSPTRNLWSLIRMQISTQKSFICPYSDDETNEDATPQMYWDFAKYQENSYGYQIPFGRYGQPSSNLDLRMPLAADKGPFGAALEAGMANPGIPSALYGTPDQWKPWNSPNHAGEGQCVLFADSHVDWSSKPTIGIKDDNIYTQWSDATGGSASPNEKAAIRLHGTPPTGNETPMSDTDTLIYP